VLWARIDNGDRCALKPSRQAIGQRRSSRASADDNNAGIGRDWCCLRYTGSWPGKTSQSRHRTGERRGAQKLSSIQHLTISSQMAIARLS
jgi:hypothetical protein